MELQWSWALLPAFLALAFGWALAAVVYAAGPRRRQNRIVAALLAVESTSLGTAFGVVPLFADPADAWAARGVEYATQLAANFLYLALLGTVASPLSRPFRSRAALGALAACAAGAFLLWPLLSGVVLSDAPPIDRTIADIPHWVRPQAPGGVAADAVYGILLLYGLAVALDAWRRAPRDTAARRQASAYAFAFGVRDAVAGPLLIAGVLLVPRPEWLQYLHYYGIAVAQVVFQALFAYGLLRSQLLDIDLRLKWTIRQSTVAAAFVAVFFVVSEGAAALLSESVGPLAGVAAAGLLVFALAPLQRAAERVSERALPGVADTAEYRTVRKREVYRAAVEGALEDGGVSDKERAMLARLAEQLGLGPVEMHDIEREARAARRLSLDAPRGVA